MWSARRGSALHMEEDGWNSEEKENTERWGKFLPDRGLT